MGVGPGKKAYLGSGISSLRIGRRRCLGHYSCAGFWIQRWLGDKGWLSSNGLKIGIRRGSVKSSVQHRWKQKMVR
jgi:hypothetical protein